MSTTLNASQLQLLEALDAWIAVHASAYVPQKATIELNGTTYPIGMRVRTTQRSYASGTLSREMQAELIRRDGWSWSTSKPASTNDLPARWERTLKELETYAGDHDGLANLKTDQIRLHSWLVRQRTALNDGRLNAAQERALRRLPGAIETSDIPRRGEARTIRFAHDLAAWLDDNDLTVTDVTRNHRFTWDGTELPTLKRILYYRSRGPKGDESLTTDEISALQSLPGWRW